VGPYQTIIPSLTAEQFLDEFRKRLKVAASFFELVETDLPDHPVPDNSPAWTNALLNLILKWGHDLDFGTYPRELIYDTRSGRNRLAGSGYLSFDACWYTREPTPWWKLSNGENHGCVLCVESEWASGLSTAPSILEEMMNDFAKLSEVKADLKVFIGVYVRRGTVDGRPMRDEFLEVTESYARSARWTYPGEQYLIMLWPVDARWDDRNDFMARVIRL
jgi:hypothetical protein